MKIAICLHGYLHNSVDPKSGFKGKNYISQQILKYGSADFFIHSWDLKNEQEILKLYSPRLFQFEPQKEFKKELSQIDQVYIDQNFNRAKSGIYKTLTPYQTFSFSYSRKRAIELKTEYEKKHNFKYDWVVTCRFDLGQRSKGRAGYRSVSEIDFNPEYNSNFLYCAIFNQLNAGYPDQWFYSNSENMDLLATFFDKAIEYYQKRSSYEIALTTGWPDSKYFDHNIKKAPEQFTNEVLKPKEQRAKDLMIYPRWQMINNHLMYKWFCIDVGLYEKTRFI